MAEASATKKASGRGKTAGERLRRLLAIVPWIVSNPGVELADVARRFGLSESSLIDDLNVVWMVGLPPYSPDSLVEVAIEDGRVWIHYADFFAKPLKLSSAQGLALIASSDGLLSIPGSELDGPLARALTKLADVLGVAPDEVLDVELGAASPDLLAQLREAATQSTEIRIGYYSYGRDEHSTRVIDPWRVHSTGGSWYVEAWCHQAEGERVFRVDRIESVELTGSQSKNTVSASARDEAEGTNYFHPNSGDPTVQIRLGQSARWVAEAYPCEVVEEFDDGSLIVALVITARPWLERLLLRLGPGARVVDEGGMPDASNIGAEAAERVLARYRDA